MKIELNLHKVAVAAVGGLLPWFAHAANVTMEGAVSAPVEIVPAASTGLEKVIVVDGLAGVKIVYAADASPVKWYRFSNLGGAYAEEISGVQRTDNIYTYSPASADDMGYLIEDGTRRYCFWVVNYANHAMTMNSASVSGADSDCATTALTVDGSAPRITYYSINGQGIELSRDIEVAYQTLEFDYDSQIWRTQTAQRSFGYLLPTITVEAPLCNTEFHIAGDRFLKDWGRELEVSTVSYDTPAVSAQTWAVQAQGDTIDNESKPDLGPLGGSAPCEVTFTAAPTDAVVFREWQMSKYEDFDVIDERFSEDEFTFVFTEQGTTYVRYTCGNADGDCMYTGETYAVAIGESKLEIPNAFSPANQDGVNDVWKVSYTSLLDFECHIFNRWGLKMATLTHPSQGWDGRYNGKFVPSGVYFYVIKATGSDGVKYNKSGDINIINSRASNKTNTDAPSAE